MDPTTAEGMPTTTKGLKAWPGRPRRPQGVAEFVARISAEQGSFRDVTAAGLRAEIEERKQQEATAAEEKTEKTAESEPAAKRLKSKVGYDAAGAGPVDDDAAPSAATAAAQQQKVFAARDQIFNDVKYVSCPFASSPFPWQPIRRGSVAAVTQFALLLRQYQPADQNHPPVRQSCSRVSYARP